MFLFIRRVFVIVILLFFAAVLFRLFAPQKYDTIKNYIAGNMPIFINDTDKTKKNVSTESNSEIGSIDIDDNISKDDPMSVEKIDYKHNYNNNGIDEREVAIATGEKKVIGGGEKKYIVHYNNSSFKVKELINKKNETESSKSDMEYSSERLKDESKDKSITVIDASSIVPEDDQQKEKLDISIIDQQNKIKKKNDTLPNVNVVNRKDREILELQKKARDENDKLTYENIGSVNIDEVNIKNVDFDKESGGIQKRIDTPSKEVDTPSKRQETYKIGDNVNKHNIQNITPVVIINNINNNENRYISDSARKEILNRTQGSDYDKEMIEYVFGTILSD